MKLTSAQVIELLKSAGLADVSIVENETDSDYALDAALMAIDAARTPVIKPTIEAEVKQAMAGLSGGKLESMLATITGIPRSSFKDGMTDVDKGKLALEHYSKKFNQDTEGLRNEMRDLVTTHNTTIDTLRADYETKVKTANDRYTERDIIEHIADELKSAPLPAGTNLSLIARDVYTHIKGLANVVWDDVKKKVEFRSLENAEMPVYTNESKSQFKGVIDWAKEKYEPLGTAFWLKDTRNSNAAEELQRRSQQQQQNGNGNNNNNNGQQSGYIDPIKAGNDKMLAWANESATA